MATERKSDMAAGLIENHGGENGGPWQARLTERARSGKGGISRRHARQFRFAEATPAEGSPLHKNCVGARADARYEVKGRRYEAKAVTGSDGTWRQARCRDALAEDGRRRLAIRLSRLAAPAVMAILFFGLVLPIGLVMRLCRRDPLRLRFEPELPSYWLPRSGRPGDRQTSMTSQF